MTQTSSKRTKIKLTRVEAVTLALCLIAIGFLLALNRYRPRKPYVEPVVFEVPEVLDDEADSNNDNKNNSDIDSGSSSNSNAALQEKLLEGGE